MLRRPTYAQTELLLEFLEKNPGIAKGLLRTIHGKMETKRKWEEMSFSLNSLGGATKTGQGWAKYWAEKKCALKKQCIQLNTSLNSGVQVDEYNDLSPLDKRFLAAMGGLEYVCGEPQNACLSKTPNKEVCSGLLVPERSIQVMSDIQMHLAQGSAVDQGVQELSTCNCGESSEVCQQRNLICLRKLQPSSVNPRSTSVSEEVIEAKIQIKSDDPSDNNIEIDEANFKSVFEAEEIETRTSHTSERNQLNENTVNTYESSENESELNDPDQLGNPLNVCTTHQPAKRSRSTDIKTNLTDFSHAIEETQPLLSCGDEFGIYGAYVASQLRQLSTEESLMARDKIQSILTHSRLKELKRKKLVQSKLIDK